MPMAITSSVTPRTSLLLRLIQQITTGWQSAGDSLTAFSPTFARAVGDLQLTLARLGRFPVCWRITFSAATRYWAPMKQETFSISAFSNRSVRTCTARWTSAKPGRVFNPTETQEEGTSSGSQLIRPAAQATASNTRPGARPPLAPASGSSVDPPTAGSHG